MKKEQKEKLEYLMNHPVFLGHDSNTKIIRAQLFFIAVSTIFIIIFEIKISENSSILGIKLENLTTDHVLWLALILLIYQIIHFIWASWEILCEWRVRQTALDTGGWGGGGIKIKSEDDANKVRQTTIYSYLVFSLDLDLKKISSLSKKNNENDIKKEDLKEILNSLENIKNKLEEERVSDAFCRFDLVFKMLFKSQNIRWFILEFILPLFLSMIAIFFIIKKIF